jgi:hypothetical protein
MLPEIDVTALMLACLSGMRKEADASRRVGDREGYWDGYKRATYAMEESLKTIERIMQGRPQ